MCVDVTEVCALRTSIKIRDSCLIHVYLHRVFWCVSLPTDGRGSRIVGELRQRLTSRPYVFETS
jgi:hypothetical protein